MHRNHTKRSVTDLEVDPLMIFHKIVEESVATCATPDRNFILGSLRAKRYGALLEYAERPLQMYQGATQYFVAAQLSSLVRKFPFTTAEIPGINPEATAIKKFLAAEHRCKRENQRRRARRKRLDPYAQIWADTRRYIRRVLGDTPNLDDIFSHCDVAPGACVGVHGNATNLARKLLSERWSVTSYALPIVIRALWANTQVRDLILPGEIKCYDKALFESLVLERVNEVSYNKVSFVPKTARTHRGIAVEPMLNGYVQKGVDAVMRDLLTRRAGLDLRNQQKNRDLAKRGSRGGFNPYSTIDLSAASDSISLELVRKVLPPEWFRLLDELRSHSYMLPDSSNASRYEKFTSMGNGFCFPLETLIFAGFCYAVGVNESDPYDFRVYGDDIIIRQNLSLHLIEVLREAGFTTNVQKTNVVGPFRESCGADWYEGQDVRPVILDKRLSDLRQVVSFHNSTLRSQRCETFFHQVRPSLRTFGPKFLRPGREPGDTAFSVPLDVAVTSPYVMWNRDMQQWTWKEVLSTPIVDNLRHICERAQVNWTQYIAVLRGASSKAPLTLRYQTKVKVRRICRPFNDRYIPFPRFDHEAPVNRD